MYLLKGIFDHRLYPTPGFGQDFVFSITGMKPQSKLWKLIPQQSCGVLNPPPSAGLFDLQISMHYVFEI